MVTRVYPDEIKLSIRYAKSKHRKQLKRKGIKYNPDAWRKIRFEEAKTNSKILTPPENFSIVLNRDEVSLYFDRIRFLQQSKEFVHADLSKISNTDLATVTLLMAHMFDTRWPTMYLTVSIPRVGEPSEIFKKVEFHKLVTQANSESAHFMSRHDTAINQDYTLSILTRVTKFFNGRKDTELNAILTEIFSNTNNHADRKTIGIVPWLITMEENASDNSINFCVLDLGIGVHESLEFKSQKMSGIEAAFNILRSFFKKSQCETLSKNIPKGLLSTTNLSYRGQGMREIYIKAKEGNFSNFNIITNKAHINLCDIDKINNDSLYNFRGTLYYWTLKYEV